MKTHKIFILVNLIFIYWQIFENSTNIDSKYLLIISFFIHSAAFTISLGLLKYLTFPFVTMLSFLNVISLSIAPSLVDFDDFQLGKFNPEEADEKSTAQLYGEVLLHFALIGILMYIVRNVVEWVPFPLNGMFGYDHLKLNELRNAGLFAVIFFLFQNNLTEKLVYLSKRV